nr:hypothetical protein CPGR_00018 [Mycolicibacter nonchromogenicus]
MPRPGAAQIGASQPGSAVFSSGRSTTNNNAITAAIRINCAALTTTKCGRPG